MAWEKRGTSEYYYQSRWRQGRSTKRYLGRGPAGMLAQQIDEQARQRREAEVAALRAEAKRLVTPNVALRELEVACSLMLEVQLLIAGFHRQNYGPWRRRRVRIRS